ncbi:MAG: methylthioribulose 1-phosphate dehydratase [Alicyclobacillaceae bacterium]|nr:methylthioribulose 1-phosphate dehydratase [Alicyclobacillaceae bacterium]
MSDRVRAKQQVLELAEFCSRKGWLPATSGNLSVRLTNRPSLFFAVTRSGVDKTALKEADVIVVDEHMSVESPDEGVPSAETEVHLKLYERLDCGSVIHVHTLFNNLMSNLCESEGYVEFRQHELLKALGHWQEDAVLRVPIVPNHADLHQLAQAVHAAASADCPGVLVVRHGIYAFGETPGAARRHLEAMEFLFEYLWHSRYR